MRVFYKDDIEKGERRITILESLEEVERRARLERTENRSYRRVKGDKLSEEEESVGMGTGRGVRSYGASAALPTNWRGRGRRLG